MTDGSGSGGGRAGSYGAASGSGNVPRRMSYASVASGATSHSQAANSQAGPMAHMATTMASSSSQPPSYSADSRQSQRYTQEQERSGGTYRRTSQLSWYSRKYAGVPGYGTKQGSGVFFVPSYLKDSRYVAKLEAAHVLKVRKEKESKSGPNSAFSSMNPSSSSVNVHRIAPSHRGMTYEVIESNPPKEEEQLMPLPSRWNDQDKYPGLDLSNDGFDVKYNGSASKSEVEAASVRADYPMSPACGMYYYEVEIKHKSKDCAVAVGFSTAKASLERLPGWEPDSWAYHGDDGKTFCGEHNGRSYSQQFTAGDVIGCGINFHTGQAFFTKNGLDLGVAFREMKNMRPFPCVGIKKYSGANVSVNFGQRPFVFNIDEKVAQERIAIEMQVRKTKTNTLHPSLDETSLVQELISQFLMHGGYVETSKAFNEEMKREKRALTNSSSRSSEQLAADENTDATNRQQIRRAILAGDIDLALDVTNKYYPHVLQQSPEIVFNLKCRKWIELISRAADLRSRQATAAEQNAGKASNGLARPSLRSEAVEDVFDQHMELDEEQQANAFHANGKASAEVLVTDPDTDMAYNQLLSQAMEYGQILQREYRDDKEGNYSKTLQNIFSLIVYNEPRESVHGHLLDCNGRMKVAEELNSAILAVSLGESPTAALENAYKQTEALLDILGSEGGAASFVNIESALDQQH